MLGLKTNPPTGSKNHFMITYFDNSREGPFFNIAFASGK